jgi:ABC-2 type transport system ATP-binding protein
MIGAPIGLEYRFHSRRGLLLAFATRQAYATHEFFDRAAEATGSPRVHLHGEGKSSASTAEGTNGAPRQAAGTFPKKSGHLMDTPSIIMGTMSIPVTSVVAAHGLSKSFGDVVAVDDLSFSVSQGEILGLLGPNGAGKTTVVRMLTTLSSIDQGSATVAGHDVATDPEAVRRVIGLAGQSAAVDEKLSARENLELFGRLYKLPRRQRRSRIDELIERFDMTDFAQRPAETYSGGQRRRLDIVAALVADPLALFLDEPTAGLDPRSRADVWESLQALASTGTAIVLTTQYLDEADRLADNILVVDQGRTVGTGTPQKLKQEAGRDVLEIRVADAADLITAQALLEAGEEAVIDLEALQLDLPITTGIEQSLGLLRRLEDRGVTISDFQLRRPTLDDVFLALTGSRTTDQERASR